MNSQELKGEGLLPSTEIVDAGVLEGAVRRFAERGIRLPTFSELANPLDIPAEKLDEIGLFDADRNIPDARNLWRVHWHNQLGEDAAFAPLPEHVVVPPELSGVESPIAVLFGDRFPMIGAHKVLAAYSCLAPRVVTGVFDPTHHRAVWPSTGNYARGGVAISRIMGCRGVAVLPENMSRERFAWLERWVANPDEDIIRTPGSESNVKEIYDKCAELDADPENIIFNQFAEFPNHLGHYEVTSRALERVFLNMAEGAGNSSGAASGLKLAAFVSASGSAGTLGAGDWLKERHSDCRIVAVEALECPTMLYNGFGEHNIQGIGDKHIPLIHNVMNTDVAVGVSDAATDSLFMAFDSGDGKRLLSERGVSAEVIDSLPHFGFSSICNLLAAIKTSKQLGLGPEDVIATVATDGSDLYASERPKIAESRFGGEFTARDAADALERHLWGADTEHTEVLGDTGRERIFNLGYFTWVEQQGVEIDDFAARKEQAFWDGLHFLDDEWDEAISEFNARISARSV